MRNAGVNRVDVLGMYMTPEQAEWERGWEPYRKIIEQSPPATPSAPYHASLEGICGKADVTDYFFDIMRDVLSVWRSTPSRIKSGLCCQIGSPLDVLINNRGGLGYVSWDINLFAGIGMGGWPFTGIDEGNPSNPCRGTVVLSGKCYYGNSVNYALWGLAYRLCAVWTGNFRRYSEKNAINVALGWKYLVGSTLINDTREFVKYGYDLRGYTPTVFGCRSCVVSSPVIVNLSPPATRWHFGNAPNRITGAP